MSLIHSSEQLVYEYIETKARLRHLQSIYRRTDWGGLDPEMREQFLSLSRREVEPFLLARSKHGHKRRVA